MIGFSQQSTRSLEQLNLPSHLILSPGPGNLPCSYHLLTPSSPPTGSPHIVSTYVCTLHDTCSTYVTNKSILLSHFALHTKLGLFKHKALSQQALCQQRPATAPQNTNFPILSVCTMQGLHNTWWELHKALASFNKPTATEQLNLHTRLKPKARTPSLQRLACAIKYVCIQTSTILLCYHIQQRTWLTAA